MPSTNLDFNVVAHTGQALGEIRLLKAQIQDLGRTLRAAVKAGDTAGAQAISQNIGSLEAQLLGLNKALGGTTGAMGGFSLASTRTMRSLLTFRGSIVSLTQSLGGLKAGFAGFAATLAVEKLASQFEEVHDRLVKLRDLGREIGIKPIAVQAAQEIARNAGNSADAVTTAMQTMGDAIRQARVEAGQSIGQVGVSRGGAGGVGVPGVQVLKGSAGDAAAGVSQFTTSAGKMVEVLRGDSKIVLDLADALKQVRVETKNFPATEKGMLEEQMAIMRGFQAQQKLLDPQRLDALSRVLFKAPAPTMLEAIPDQIAKITQQIAELEKSERGATEARLANLKELDASRGRLLTAWQEMDTAVFNFLAPNVAATNDAITNFLTKSLPDWMARTKAAFADFWPQLETDFAQGMAQWKFHLPDFSAWIESTKAAFAGLWDSIKSGASSIANAVAAMPGGVMPAFATGGMVRGPGGPTSDSILARLSNGEFVMSAGAVQRWGAGLLASMNGGGSLIPRNGKYAAGGLVAAGGGAPVHLHLGGQSFALAGNQNVVDALVVEAHRHKIRSAGTKPSWYGGTPGR